MITHIEIEGFKSLKKVALDLGGLNIFIGTNASGKSNFFEALRVLQGIGYGFTISEIFDGKPKSATGEVWEGIRGGSALASFRNSAVAEPSLRIVRFTVKLKAEGLDQPLTYSIAIDTGEAQIRSERLWVGENLENLIFGEQLASVPGNLTVPMLALAPLPDVFGVQLTKICRALLADTQVLDPAAENLRDYSKVPQARRMGDRGENFAGLVSSILPQDATTSAYTSWLKQLTPAELDEVVLLRGALKEPLFAFKKGNQAIPASILSDGTLRFAAIAAAFFQPDMPRTLLIEEIETGLHPTRLRLLLELLRSQSVNGTPQVMATSHSPQVLAWLTEDDYKTTFLCRKDEETGASTIIPLSEVPGFLDLARKQPASDLFAEGWLEGAL
ncbi:MAG TPA: AAA family ATPase [Candidatus Acidoferrales bacterium]|nr:AAA family ATPase [Candidatus Acidoferrales bacterium]